MARPRKSRYLKQQQPSGVWYVFPDRVSARTTDRSQAERYLAQLEAGTHRPLAPDQPLIKDILEGYERDRIKEVRSQAIVYACKALRERLGELEPQHISQGTVAEYAAQRGRKPGTVIRELVTLRAALQWAKREKWMADVPVFRMPVKTPPPRERWLTEDECRRLIDECKHEHLQLFVVLALGTAARSSAILELTWDRVDFHAGRIDFGEGHGNKRRSVVPMSKRVREALEEAETFRGTSGRVIEWGGEPVLSVKKAFAAACKRAGLHGVTPHILRHTWATHAAMRGVPMREIARVLGDSEKTVEKIYAKHSPDYLRTAIEWL